MTSDELRQLYLRFFEERGHSIVPSAPLVPRGDPTLLFTSAGMVQFKRYYTGEAVPTNPRLASCQKCFRTTDIDAVGDTKHLTFFEMLGNFSIGDYFKKETIAWAWEFVRERLHLSQERLWITIYLDDEEAFQHWRAQGVPVDRILRYGEEDNFWGPAGDSGPCGPCSEIHYDFGEKYGCGQATCAPNCDCGRFLEIWNLVFTQFNQDLEGKRTPLPKPNIDTGLGLERTAAVLQEVTTAYETDLFKPLIQRVSELTGKSYGAEPATDRALRVIAEHGRALTFLISDGVVPSNEGRGYVLRRILRRAVSFARKLGLEEPFLAEVIKVVVDRMSHIYPELTRSYPFVLSVAQAEEAKFHQTLDVGLNLLDGILREAKEKGEKVLPGAAVFRLYDTYGFPQELTAEVAKDEGLSIDRGGFEAEMGRQRERARAAALFGSGGKATAASYERLGLSATNFVGYKKLSHSSTIVGLFVDGQPVERAEAGQSVEIVLQETPFYGEMGGQVGDAGEIVGEHGRVEITEVIRPLPELIAHRGKVVQGYLALNDSVEARVDAERRLDIARNHTATHLLQAALRQVLGTHVQQAGSLVAPDRLRFDFTHPSPLSKEDVKKVQRLVNERVRQNLPVKAQMLPYTEAIAQGAIALFDEKYGDTVRLMEIRSDGERISAELCGGTHLEATGEIGFCLITAEASIGSGLRRIEAVTGRGAEALLEERLGTLEEMARELGSNPAEVHQKLATLLEELEKERKGATLLERELARREVETLLPRAESVNGITILATRVSSTSPENLRQMGDWLRDRLKSGLIVLGTVYQEKPSFVAMVTPDLVARGFHAGEIVKQVAAVTGGGGGGRPQMAQAGGKDKTKLDEALRLVSRLVKKGD